MTATTPADPLRALHLWLLLAIFAGSAAVKLIYVFGYTNYSQYVYADSFHYFHRALAFYVGQRPYHVDWDVFPMGNPVLLAGCWRLLEWLGVVGHHLETTMVINVVNSSLCVLLAFHLSWRLTARTQLSLLVAAASAFYYPLIFLCAFVLSEPFAQVFFMASLSSAVEAGHARRPTPWLLLAGTCWALACQVRGSFALAALPALLILLRNPPAPLGRLRAAASYLLPAATVFAAASLALWLVTDGEAYKPTGNNGGFNFFLQQCRFFGAHFRQDDYSWYFYPATFSRQPELGLYSSQVPFADQGYYFRESFRCIAEQPGSIKRMVAFAPTMLYSRFFPDPESARGYVESVRWCRHVNLLMVLLAPAGYIALRRHDARGAGLLLGTMLVLWFTFAEFNADHRHLYALSHLGFLFALAGVAELAARGWRRRGAYLATAAAVTATGFWLFGSGGPLSLYDHKPVRIEASLLAKPVTNGTRWYSLDAFRFWSPVTIDLGGTRHARVLQLALDGNDVYELSFLRGERRLGRVQLSLTNRGTRRFMVSRRVEIPEAIAAAGYDGLLLRAVEGDGHYSVAYLRFDDPPAAVATPPATGPSASPAPR